MSELTNEVAIGKRMHVIDQSSKSHLINRAVCLKPDSHLRHNDITGRSRKQKRYLGVDVLCL